jgi:hypothetical protein
MKEPGCGADAPLPGGAGRRQRLMISQRMNATSPARQSGTWVGSGAINDAGRVDATAVVVEHGGGKALIKATHRLAGVDGTITLESHTWFRPFPPPSPERVMVRGKWKQISGTGLYADMSSRGKLYATIDQTTGEITIVRDGKGR